MASSTDKLSHRPNHIPTIAKIVILAQAATILSFSILMYQEYLNNVYFQTYITGLIHSSLIADALLSMTAMSLFALGTFTLLGSMNTARMKKDWHYSSRAREEVSDTIANPVLETVESPTRGRRTSRRRRRRSGVSPEEIFQSMVHYVDNQGAIQNPSQSSHEKRQARSSTHSRNRIPSPMKVAVLREAA